MAVAKTRLNGVRQNPDTQARILEAALVCVKRWGIEKVTLNDIAQEAGVTRPTVYNYYASRDEIVRQALMQSGLAFAQELLKSLERLDSPAERVVEAVVFTLKKLPKEPALALLTESSLASFFNTYTLTAQESHTVRRALFRSVLKADAMPEEELDEVAEVATRFLLSLLTMQSSKKRTDKELRGFLQRRLLPALSL